MRRFLIGLGAVAALFVFWLLAIWPPPVWYATHWPRETAFMEMREVQAARRPLPRASAQKKVTATPKPVEYRPVPLDSIAAVMQSSVIIGEDNNFLVHGGLDYLALAHALGYRRKTFEWGDSRDREALWTVLPKAWSRRDRLRGASTITQQLAKNLYLSASRNPLRKVKEAVTAWRLEAALEKHRIMELYLNIVELGDGVWGVEAASQHYFGKSALSLTREEAAALAGSLPFPLRSNPGYRPGRMRWRQNLILRRMRGEEVEVPKLEPDITAVPESAAVDTTTEVVEPVVTDSTARTPADITQAPAVDSAGQ